MFCLCEACSFGSLDDLELNLGRQSLELQNLEHSALQVLELCSMSGYNKDSEGRRDAKTSSFGTISIRK